MNIIITLIIGGVIGWIASMIMKTNAQMGMAASGRFKTGRPGFRIGWSS